MGYLGFKNHSKSQALLLMVLDALSKSFSYERHFMEYKLEDENLESYWQRVKKLLQERTRPLMDSIDTLMQAVIDETKDYIVSPYAKAMTYYQNQWEAMRYFLKDPGVLATGKPWSKAYEYWRSLVKQRSLPNRITWKSASGNGTLKPWEKALITRRGYLGTGKPDKNNAR